VERHDQARAAAAGVEDDAGGESIEAPHVAELRLEALEEGSDRLTLARVAIRLEPAPR
jgi:hypothetical protein